MEKEAWELEYNLQVSQRYHLARRGFFETCANINRAASAFAGLGTAVSTLGLDNIILSSAFGLATGLLASFDLAFDFNAKARKYEDYYRKYTDMLGDFKLKEITAENIKQLDVKRILYNGEEPAAIKTLVRICQNEVAEVNGLTEGYVLISRQQRWVCQLFSFGAFPPDLTRSQSNVQPRARMIFPNRPD